MKPRSFLGILIAVTLPVTSMGIESSSAQETSQLIPRMRVARTLSFTQDSGLGTLLYNRRSAEGDIGIDPSEEVNPR